jgi:ParB/RepB/Spo0J family partition protein
MRSSSEKKTWFAYIPTEKVKPSQLNPRTIFDPTDIEELAQSFIQYGIIQPIIVYPQDTQFIIICGERRWRAAKQAKLDEMPALVHSIPPTDETALSLALIENMHRKDIDVLSEATAIRNLVDGYGWTQADIASKLGVSNSYVRHRYLLTRFPDMIEAYQGHEISLSEAVELSTLDSSTMRAWFIQRLKNHEFQDFSQFITATSRYRTIRKLIDKGFFVNQILERSSVQFDLDGLPYCGKNCSNYVRLTWEERKHYGIESEKPGWVEYCAAENNDCYIKKKAVRQDYYKALQQVTNKRPIPDDGWISMLWFKHGDADCRSCINMINSSEMVFAGIPIDHRVHAYCVSQDEKCYDGRTSAYMNAREEHKKTLKNREMEKKKQILDSVPKAPAESQYGYKNYLTKRECAYLIMQYICYSGGKDRLEVFAEEYSLKNHLPSKYNSQVVFVRNKLIDDFSENQLLSILFSVAAASAAYSLQEIEPLCFDRNIQKEVSIFLGSSNE